MKTILFVGGGFETVPGLRRAAAMGLHVIVSDCDPDAPGFAEADDAVLASTYDVEGTVAAARRYHETVRRIDGVLCLAADVPLTVASVAEALGLPGIPVEAARLSMDKLAMKRRFAKDGVPIPWFSAVDSAAELAHVIALRGLPLVLKPVDSRGARGVLLLRGRFDVGAAFLESRRHSPTGRVMVEEFLAGPQLSTESVVIDGVAHTPGFSDRNYEHLERFAPHIVENGGELPTRLGSEIRREVGNLVGRAARSLGIRNGVAKGDIVVTDGRPFVIEIATRLSGGYFCTHEIPLSTGVDVVGAAIRMSLGERVDPRELEPRHERGVAQRWVFPAPGRVARILGVDAVRRRSDVALCETFVGEGDTVGPIDSHVARAAMVICCGESREDAAARAASAAEAITIETEAIPC